MKKTLLILVIVAMLISCFAIAVPAGAEEETYDFYDAVELLDKAIADAEAALADETKVYLAEARISFDECLAAAKVVYAGINKDDCDIQAIVDTAMILKAATADLANNLGGKIYNQDDFVRYAKFEGEFVLEADITISAPIANFKCDLDGNGHTITLNKCALATEFEGSVKNLTVAGTTNGAQSLFGKAVGEVSVVGLKVTANAFEAALLFDAAAEGAKIKVTNVVASSEAPAISAVEATLANAYLQNVEYYALDAKKSSEAEVATGKAAYYVNAAFDEVVLVQVIGADKYPVIGAAAFDGANVVVQNNDGKLVNKKNFELNDGIDMPTLDQGIPDTRVTEGLENAIARAEALKAEDYEDASWALLTLVLTEAKSVLENEDATQRMIDLASSSVTIQIASLKAKPVETPAPVVDFAKLDEAIAAAKAITDKDTYTDTSWAKLKVALAMAEVAKSATAQSAVDSAVDALNTAIKGLAKAPATEAPTEAPATEPVPEEEGCGSVIGGAAVVVAAVAAIGMGVSFKKRED